MSIENRQLSESLKKNELRENNFKTQILELEESVEKWRLKQRQSSSKISQKNVKIAEMTKMMEIMEMAANRKSRRIDVKSSHHRRGLRYYIIRCRFWSTFAINCQMIIIKSNIFWGK